MVLVSSIAFFQMENIYFANDKNGYKGLFHLLREAPYPHTHLSDEHFDLHLKKQVETEKKGYIIATHPLTDEKWQSFKPGELKVFNNGNLDRNILF